jgi:pimeloyl-[acyl-carrier protein] synthase
MQKLRDEPALIDAAVEEILCYHNPVQIVYRSAAEEVELGGKRIGREQLVSLVVGAANRDPAQFDEPDRLDLSRPEVAMSGWDWAFTSAEVRRSPG